MTQRGAWTPDKVRLRIKTGVIMKRLSDQLLGRVDLSPTQIKAADILLRKTVPDLQRTELTGKDGAPIIVQATALDDEQ